MSSKTAKAKTKTHPIVVMEAEVARKIRQHCRTSMKTEVCGVLIGSADDDRTLIEASIAGINAAQGGTHVTFTQDTWEHIYRIKDQQYPDDKIVGWYHSHPGFGVFLSEHDLFIHENFFSSPQQVAWVYDPHTDEEGCFGWVGGKTEKLGGVRFGYSQSVDTASAAAAPASDEIDDELDSMVRVRPASQDEESEPAWVKWASRTLIFLALLGVGFLLGHEYMALQVSRQMEQMAPILAACKQVVDHPVESCQQILQDPRIVSGQAGSLPSAMSPPGAGQPQASPGPAKPAPAKKENNGKQ
jgi:proteasome lid subunit RPN8/RPN11